VSRLKRGGKKFDDEDWQLEKKRKREEGKKERCNELHQGDHFKKGGHIEVQEKKAGEASGGERYGQRAGNRRR